MITPTQARRFWRARRDWLGSGQVVSQAEADRRAAVCRVCPKHVERPLQELLTGPMADRVKAQLAVKAHLKLVVGEEEKLHTCGMCECYMPLKVWMPLDRAREVSPDWLHFPEECWIRSETSYVKKTF